MSLKSFIGPRRNSTMLFIVSLLVAAVVVFKSMARPKGQSSLSPSGVPPILKSEVDIQFSYAHIPNAGNWLAVSKMETAGWTSGAYVHALNPWGMMTAKVRPDRQAGSYLGTRVGDQVTFGLARYDSIEDAVADLALWMDYVKFPKREMTIQEHVVAMDTVGYFGDEDAQLYLAKVLAWEKR